MNQCFAKKWSTTFSPATPAAHRTSLSSIGIRLCPLDYTLQDAASVLFYDYAFEGNTAVRYPAICVVEVELLKPLPPHVATTTFFVLAKTRNAAPIPTPSNAEEAAGSQVSADALEHRRYFHRRLHVVERVAATHHRVEGFGQGVLRKSPRTYRTWMASERERASCSTSPRWRRGRRLTRYGRRIVGSVSRSRRPGQERSWWAGRSSSSGESTGRA